MSGCTNRAQCLHCAARQAAIDGVRQFLGKTNGSQDFVMVVGGSLEAIVSIAAAHCRPGQEAAARDDLVAQVGKAFDHYLVRAAECAAKRAGVLQ